MKGFCEKCGKLRNLQTGYRMCRVCFRKIKGVD